MQNVCRDSQAYKVDLMAARKPEETVTYNAENMV